MGILTFFDENGTTIHVPFSSKKKKMPKCREQEEN